MWRAPAQCEEGMANSSSIRLQEQRCSLTEDKLCCLSVASTFRDSNFTTRPLSPIPSPFSLYAPTRRGLQRPLSPTETPEPHSFPFLSLCSNEKRFTVRTVKHHITEGPGLVLGSGKSLWASNTWPEMQAVLESADEFNRRRNEWKWSCELSTALVLWFEGCMLSHTSALVIFHITFLCAWSRVWQENSLSL